MPNPYPTALRERAVRAYETSTETYADVAARFAIGLNTLLRWVQRARATGDVSPFDKRGGWQWIERIDPRRLVFLDESGANLAMGRSHAWLPRGTELIEPRPMNWGDNLTLVGAIRMDRLLTLATSWEAMTTARFNGWVRRHLVRHLRRGDVVVMDNLAAHKARQVRELIEPTGANLRVLPPYSYDVNPIEAARAPVQKHIPAVAAQ